MDIVVQIRFEGIRGMEIESYVRLLIIMSHVMKWYSQFLVLYSLKAYYIFLSY